MWPIWTDIYLYSVCRKRTIASNGIVNANLFCQSPVASSALATCGGFHTFVIKMAAAHFWSLISSFWSSEEFQSSCSRSEWVNLCRVVELKLGTLFLALKVSDGLRLWLSSGWTFITLSYWRGTYSIYSSHSSKFRYIDLREGGLKNCWWNFLCLCLKNWLFFPFLRDNLKINFSALFLLVILYDSYMTHIPQLF